MTPKNFASIITASIFGMINHKMSKRKFCKECQLSRKGFRKIEKNDKELDVYEVMRVFDFVEIPHKYMFLSLDCRFKK